MKKPSQKSKIVARGRVRAAKAKKTATTAKKSGKSVQISHLQSLMADVIASDNPVVIQAAADLLAVAVTMKEQFEENNGVDEDADEEDFEDEGDGEETEEETDEEETEEADEEEAEEDDEDFSEDEETEEESDEEETEEEDADEDFSEDEEETEEESDEEETEEDADESEEDDPFAGYSLADYAADFDQVGLTMKSVLGSKLLKPGTTKDKKIARAHEVASAVMESLGKYNEMKLPKLIKLAKLRKVKVNIDARVKKPEAKVERYALALAGAEAKKAFKLV